MLAVSDTHTHRKSLAAPVCRLLFFAHCVLPPLRSCSRPPCIRHSTLSPAACASASALSLSTLWFRKKGGTSGTHLKFVLQYLIASQRSRRSQSARVNTHTIHIGGIHSLGPDTPLLSLLCAGGAHVCAITDDVRARFFCSEADWGGDTEAANSSQKVDGGGIYCAAS